MLAVELLYEKMLLLNKASTSRKFEVAVYEVLEVKRVSHAANLLLCLIDDAKSEVEACQFKRPEKWDRYLKTLNELRGGLFEIMLLRDRTSIGPMFQDVTLERLLSISDAVSENLVSSSTSLDRAGFASQTLALIEEVKNWEVGDFERRSLILALQMIAQQAVSSDSHNSDQEIRRRIKSVVASFCVEFCGLDREFETKFETIKRWARLGYDGASTPLGLTSSAAKVAGLLPKP